MTAITKKIVNMTEVPVTVDNQLGYIIIQHVRDPSRATFQITVRATTKNFNPLNEAENEAVIKRIGDELKTVVKKALEDRFFDLQALDLGNPEQMELFGKEDGDLGDTSLLGEFGTEHVERYHEDEELIIGDKERAGRRPKAQRKSG